MRTLLCLLFLTGLCSGQSQDPKAYLNIIGGQQLGPVTKTSTYADIAAIVGTAYIEEGEVYLGEGQTSPATVVYPGHPNRRIKVIWKKGPRATATPESAWLVGDESEWRTPNGITLGTPLSKLQKLNGKPFKLLGFEWDYSGAVTDFMDGLLAKQFSNISLRLRLPENQGGDELLPVLGDQELRSDHKVLQKFEPVVDRIIVRFD